jgi:carboxypeptidase Taq
LHYERAVRVPANYVARVNAHGSASYNAWIRARPANDFAAMIPFLEKTLELSREYAAFFAPYLPLLFSKRGLRRHRAG